MKRMLILVLLGNLLLAACGPAAVPLQNVPTVTVTNGVASKTYTAADLRKLGQTQAEDQGVIYLGVPIVDLLYNAGYDPATVVTVQAVASDGFIVDYDQILIEKSDALLAYARMDGSLSDDERPFRVVLPGQAGKLNPRKGAILLIVHP